MSEQPTKFPRWRWIVVVAAALLLVALLLPPAGDSTSSQVVSYSAFLDAVEGGNVKSVNFRGDSIEGEMRGPTLIDGKTVSTFTTRRPTADDALVQELRNKAVDIQVLKPESSTVRAIITAVFPWLLIIAVWVWILRRSRRSLGDDKTIGGLVGASTRRVEKSERVEVSFEDVAGLRAAKQDLGEVVQFLTKPERFGRLGGRAPRGILLVGPPGTGKTLLARALAGESGVPFFRISASEFIELFVGVGAARVRHLFAAAKKAAPAIVFIDELDAVGRARGAGLGGGHDEREQTLNQLLSEMDGFDTSDNIVVLAATNRPDVLDPALTRPGRFDRRVLVDRPERLAREAILKVHVRKKPLADDVDLAAIAAETPGFSGADLGNLVNEAALGATRRDGSEITSADFAEAFDKVVLGDLRETTLDHAERRRVAIHESGHAVIAHVLEEAEPPRRISILPRGLALGATQQTPRLDRHLQTKDQLTAELCVLLGGFCAEKLVTGSASSGAENDLKRATETAFTMVAHFGMSESLGPVYVSHGIEHPFLGQRIATQSGTSDATIHQVEREVHKVLADVERDVTELLERNRVLLERLLQALLEFETLEGDGLREVLGAGPSRKNLRMEGTNQ